MGRGGSRTNLKEGQLVVGALKIFQKLVMRVRYIQQFHTLTADRRLSIHVLTGAILAFTRRGGGGNCP